MLYIKGIMVVYATQNEDPFKMERMERKTIMQIFQKPLS